MVLSISGTYQYKRKEKKMMKRWQYFLKSSIFFVHSFIYYTDCIHQLRLGNVYYILREIYTASKQKKNGSSAIF